MRLRTAAGAVCLAALCVVAPTLRADEDSIDRQLEEIRRRMGEMKKDHQREMEALREELEKSRRRAEQGRLAAEVEEFLAGTDEERTRAIEEGDGPFIARGLGLQALNPEISVAGDMITAFRDRNGEPWETDFLFRVLDIHIESYLDPYTLFKAAIGVNKDGAELGEAYVTRFGILERLNLTAGKFRQQFGVVNRWHKHALDQVDFPLALLAIFGEEGLNQVGFSAEYALPDWGSASQEAILQITGGQNGRLFGQNPRHLPSILLRYKNFRDLSKDTYLELGATGLVGWNEEWEVAGATVRDRRTTWAAGLDATVRWEPTERMRYANLEWRTEFYLLGKGVLSPDGSGSDTLTAWGAYTSLQRRISRTVDIGIRLDYYRPDSKPWADQGFEPHAFTGPDPYRWRVGPYLTWWQSPFVRARIEVGYEDGNDTGPSLLEVLFQITFAAGPHKHERY